MVPFVQPMSFLHRRQAVMTALLLLGALAIAGCAGYRLGPTNGIVAGSKTIRVHLFPNQTLEPRLSEAVGSALRKRLQQDGTFKLATSGTADVVVTGVITRYERTALSFQPLDIITASDFEISLYARITAEDRTTGKKLLDREVRGRTTVRVGADQASGERMAVPLLADDLAINATSALVDGRW